MKRRTCALLSVLVAIALGCAGCSSAPPPDTTATTTPLPGRGDRPYVYCGKNFGDSWPLVIDATRRDIVTRPSIGTTLVLLSKQCHVGVAVVVSPASVAGTLKFYPTADKAFAVEIPAGATALALSLTLPSGRTRQVSITSADPGSSGK